MITESDMLYVEITPDMMRYANSLHSKLKMDRTVESEIDSLIGLMGELVFASWFYGDYMKGNTLAEIKENYGQPDFDRKYEIKASCHKYSENLNLPVREDYAKKRTPQYYIQVLFDTEKPAIDTHTRALLIGWIDGYQATEGKEPQTMGRVTSFKCYLTPFKQLHPMSDLKDLESF
tara:strand:- start:658 stop:1185 length:528 start_codon:yes stop_codon:yes gene_type:complete